MFSLLLIYKANLIISLLFYLIIGVYLQNSLAFAKNQFCSYYVITVTYLSLKLAKESI